MESITRPNDVAIEAAEEIKGKAARLEKEARTMRSLHQIFTVVTIILGVAAPAFVTYTPDKNGPINPDWWKLIAVIVTAIATASATIRTVLRYGERYSNSAMTAIALEELSADLHAKRQEILATVKDEFIAMKIYETAVWGKRQMFLITKAFVEKDVSAITKDRVDLEQPPKIDSGQKIDPTKKT